MFTTKAFLMAWKEPLIYYKSNRSIKRKYRTVKRYRRKAVFEFISLYNFRLRLMEIQWLTLSLYEISHQVGKLLTKE